MKATNAIQVKANPQRKRRYPNNAGREWRTTRDRRTEVSNRVSSESAIVTGAAYGSWFMAIGFTKDWRYASKSRISLQSAGRITVCITEVAGFDMQAERKACGRHSGACNGYPQYTVAMWSVGADFVPVGDSHRG
ncbi:hypothetical protein LF1_00320 [Rubripirellula obstinata]|uniref:Uncharacterized protein n=1 Tax=Rubripirellula obstinata TaxID=406547 RepID=A0A5B1CC03_9BACT|nr:hypothetical protein LF1_00320 [Rubripirellula obstinata]